MSSYLLSSLSAMTASSSLIASLPFHQSLSFSTAVLESEDDFESTRIRDTHPHELSLFRPSATNSLNNSADGQPDGWTATKRHPPRRNISREKPSPLKERRTQPGAGGPDPARALRAAQKLLEVYPLPRAQEHVQALFDQYNGLVKVIDQLEDAYKRPIQKQTQSPQIIKAQEREIQIKNEEMEIFALEQINLEKEAENKALTLKIQARTAKPKPVATKPAPKPTTRAPASRPPPITISIPSPPVQKSLSPRTPRSPRHSAGSSSTPTKSSPLRRSLPAESTTPKRLRSVPSVGQMNHKPQSPKEKETTPKAKKPKGISMEELDLIAAKIWAGVGDALRPWARQTLLRDSAAVPSPLKSLPFNET
ncbi:hypothetical protein P7C70_g6921, partial [Phenoliferia sp. Uapishka_3]